MKPKHLFLIVVYVSLTLISCQKDKLFISDTPSNFNEIFETFWNKMNVNYVYWDIDTTHWDEIYIKYKPIFAQLDLNDTADVLKSVTYFDDITKGLIDGHYYISFINPFIIGSYAYPSLGRKVRLSHYHYPYLYYSIDTNYLDPNYILGSDYNMTYNGYPLTVLYGTIDNRILFFSATSFSLFKSYYSKTSSNVQVALQSFFCRLANMSENIKGLIIDVRGNPGGDLADLNFFVGHFID
ncbi:MAG TPA: S41 family peptidase, partial [Bacteroidales bacterium]